MIQKFIFQMFEQDKLPITLQKSTNLFFYLVQLFKPRVEYYLKSLNFKLWRHTGSWLTNIQEMD